MGPDHLSCPALPPKLSCLEARYGAVGSPTTLAAVLVGRTFARLEQVLLGNLHGLAAPHLAHHGFVAPQLREVQVCIGSSLGGGGTEAEAALVALSMRPQPVDEQGRPATLTMTAEDLLTAALQRVQQAVEAAGLTHRVAAHGRVARESQGSL